MMDGHSGLQKGCLNKPNPRDATSVAINNGTLLFLNSEIMKTESFTSMIYL